MSTRSRKITFLGSRSRPLGLKILPPFVSRMSRQYEILNISQPYRVPRPVTGIALFFYFSYFMPNNNKKSHRSKFKILQDGITFQLLRKYSIITSVIYVSFTHNKLS
jgi:hypothetical protein